MKLTKTQKSLIKMFGCHTCPSCDIPLDNGVSDYESQLQLSREEKNKDLRITHEYMCLACGEEFGEEVVKTTKLKNKGSGTKRVASEKREYTLRELCDQVDIDTKAARRTLRKIFGAQHQLYTFNADDAKKVIKAKSFEVLA